MRRFKLTSAITGLIWLFSLFILPLQAEQKIVQAGYEVHYSAIPTSFLTPEVAKSYELTRSRVMALINIAVLKINADGSTTPVNALVSGEAKNLIQQVKPLQFHKVLEGEAIYYISSFRFSNEERLDFNLSVQPDPNKEPINVSFSQTFYEE